MMEEGSVVILTAVIAVFTLALIISDCLLVRHGDKSLYGPIATLSAMLCMLGIVKLSLLVSVLWGLQTLLWVGLTIKELPRGKK